ncbi:MAG: hypothetical protein QW568_03950 [Candidatus Anstonellaceae archaeon]
MRSCSRCGRMLEDFDVGGDGICHNCEASSGHGSGTDVPCQRCGMYLPSHELQMWNSRLYCAYCIMDVKDEEKMMREGGKHHHKPDSEPLDQDFGKRQERCQKCGRSADFLYSSQGMRLFSHCYSEGGATGGKPEGGNAGGIAQIVSQIFGKSSLPKQDEPKIITRQSQKIVFDPKTRKMEIRRSEEKTAADEHQGDSSGEGKGSGIISSLKRKFSKKD